MKKRKRFRILALALVCIFILSGCQGYSGSGEEENYEKAVVPQGKPKPQELDEDSIDKEKEGTCTLLVECSTILKNKEDLTKGKEELIPEDGIIFPETEVTFYEGESVFDVLMRELQKKKIHMEYNFTPIYHSNYIEGINNIYELDCGKLSGWTYSVNGWFPSYGCSQYAVQQGDAIEWHYTCDLGRDVGDDTMNGREEGNGE